MIAPSTDWQSNPWRSEFIETNRIRLHYVTQGEGELVILLHGFPEFWYSWRHQIPALARHFKVVVPDLRGYNDSDKPTGGYDLATLGADIRGIIKGLGYTKANIVGHDWGGIIAWYLGQHFPQSLHRLAILNAPHPQRYTQELLSNLDQVRRSWYVFAFQIPGLPEWLIQQNLKEFVQTVFPGLSVRKGAFSATDTEIYQSALAKPGVLSAAINYYRQFLSLQNWTGQNWLGQNWVENWTSLPQALPLVGSFFGKPTSDTQKPLLGAIENASPVTVPTLILWSEDDPFLSQTLVEGLDSLITAPYRVKLIADCGHWMQQEVPQTVNRELLAFLREP